MSARAPTCIAAGIHRLASRPRFQPPRKARGSSFSCPRCIHATTPLYSGSTRSPKHPLPSTPVNGRPRAALIAGAGLLSLLAAFTLERNKDEDLSAPTRRPTPVDTRDPSLPRYRLSDVRLHDASSPNPWVTHDDKVYDITDWISAHPGGDVILRAAGSSIEPYWAIFSIHKQSNVREILEGYLIGYIHIDDLVDGLPPRDAVEDPFASDPIRDERLFKHTVRPCNAEPQNQTFAEEFLTPNELFYVRNHMWVPVVEGEAVDKHTLTVELPGGQEKKYTLEELKGRFKTHRVTAVLQCSGNRRSDMTRHADKTNGLQWGVGAISNAEWEGVRLMDVLDDAGLKVVDLKGHTATTTATTTTTTTTTTSSSQENGDDDEDLADPNVHHVQFTGLEAYGASIPLSTVLDPRSDVLLAFGMNGQPLPRDHGFPLRAVVPGHVAARSVKWLSKIVVSDEESASQWQRHDYKCFGPNERKPDWSRAPAIQEMPITSAVTNVLVGECVRESKAAWLRDKLQQCSKTGEEEPIALQGYAISGGGREVTRVDISLDGGKTWDQGELLKESCQGNKAWAWKRWRYLGHVTISAQGVCTEVVVKATDNSYNSQPQTHASIYNTRGNLANAWHRLRVCPTCSPNTKDVKSGKAEKKPLMIWRTGKAYGCGFGHEPEDLAQME